MSKCNGHEEPSSYPLRGNCYDRSGGSVLVHVRLLHSISLTVLQTHQQLPGSASSRSTCALPSHPVTQRPHVEPPASPQRAWIRVHCRDHGSRQWRERSAEFDDHFFYIEGRDARVGHIWARGSGLELSPLLDNVLMPGRSCSRPPFATFRSLSVRRLMIRMVLPHRISKIGCESVLPLLNDLHLSPFPS